MITIQVNDILMNIPQGSLVIVRVDDRLIASLNVTAQTDPTAHDAAVSDASELMARITARAALRAALNRLHSEAGLPSMRTVAKSTGGRLSHTTVHHALQGRQLPTFDTLAELAKALNGNIDDLKPLWLVARRGY